MPLNDITPYRTLWRRIGNFAEEGTGMECSKGNARLPYLGSQDRRDLGFAASILARLSNDFGTFHVSKLEPKVTTLCRHHRPCRSFYLPLKVVLFPVNLNLQNIAHFCCTTLMNKPRTVPLTYTSRLLRIDLIRRTCLHMHLFLGLL